MQDFSEALIEAYQILSEKWETFDAGWGPTKLWHSNSASEFRAFLQNASSAGIKGLRLSIGSDIYLAARASDLNHDNIVNIAQDAYLTTERAFEWSICGYPKVRDFEEDNYENNKLDAEDLAFYTSETDARYASYTDEDVYDPETGELLWIHDGKRHTLVADCGSFEVSLYNFYSQQFPQFRYGDSLQTKYEKKLFEASQTYSALKPLIKRLYMTNM
jgi:hypothetical protein